MPSARYTVYTGIVPSVYRIHRVVVPSVYRIHWGLKGTNEKNVGTRLQVYTVYLGPKCPVYTSARCIWPVFVYGGVRNGFKA